jgi:hypothetical protein
MTEARMDGLELGDMNMKSSVNLKRLIAFEGVAGVGASVTG